MEKISVEHLIERAEDLMLEIGPVDWPTLCARLPTSEAEAWELIRLMATRKLIEPVSEPPDDLGLWQSWWWELRYLFSSYFRRAATPTEAQLNDEAQLWSMRAHFLTA